MKNNNACEDFLLSLFPPKEETYELEIEFNEMIFRLDIKNLEQFMKTITKIGGKL